MPNPKQLVSAIILSLWAIFAIAQPERELAQQYVEEGEYAKAAPLLEQLYKKVPSGPIFEDLLTCYLQLENYRDAEKLIKEQQRNTRGAQAALTIRLMYVHSLTGDTREFEKTESDLMDMVRARPGLAGNLSQECSKYGLFETALKVLGTAESQLPSMNLGYQKALVYADMGDMDNMFREYLDLLNTNPGYMNLIKNTLNQSLQDDPQAPVNLMFRKQLIKRVQSGDNPLYNDLLVWMLIREKNYSGAMVQLRAMERRGLNQSSQIMDLAINARQEEEWQVALDAYEYQIAKGENDPLYEDAIVQKLITEYEMMDVQPTTTPQEWQSWISNLDKVKEQAKYPENVHYLNLLKGMTLQERLGENDQARSIFTSLINKPGVPLRTRLEAKLQLAGLTLQEGAYIDALLLYAQVEKEVPENKIGQYAKFMKAKVAYYRGDFNYAQGQFDALKASTSKLIANDAMYMWLLIKSNSGLDTNTVAMETFASADLAFFRKNYSQALEILDQLRVQFPNHELLDDALFLEAQIYEDQGMNDTALSLYDQLVREHKKSLLADDALYRAGLLEERLGRVEKAMALYQEILRSHPDSFFAPDARKRFRRLRGDDLVN